MGGGGGGGGGGGVNMEMLGRRMMGDGFDETMMTTSVCHANVPRRPETLRHSHGAGAFQSERPVLPDFQTSRLHPANGR